MIKLKCVATGRHCFFTVGQTYLGEPGEYRDANRFNWIHVCQDDCVSDLEGEDRWTATPMRGTTARYQIPGNSTILEVVE